MGWVKDTVRSRLPAWIIVLSVSAVIGATSAVISVAAYRDLKNRDSPISVPSESDDRID